MEIENQVATQAEVRDFGAHLKDSGATHALAAPVPPVIVPPVVETPEPTTETTTLTMKKSNVFRKQICEL